MLSIKDFKLPDIGGPNGVSKQSLYIAQGYGSKSTAVNEAINKNDETNYDDEEYEDDAVDPEKDYSDSNGMQKSSGIPNLVISGSKLQIQKVLTIIFVGLQNILATNISYLTQ
jgi:hypothetical protein